MQENLVQEQRSAIDTDAAVERAYSTDFGQMLVGKIEDALNSPAVNEVKGKVNLILTSPPFPLVRKKAYGNTTGQEYLEWIEGLAPQLTNLLADDGSIVIEIGNAWIKGEPEMSTLPLETLLAFKKAANLHLCQEIICHNPARLDLSRFSAAPGARLSHLSFEGDRTFPAECRVSASRIIEPVYVFEDRHLSLPPRFP